MPNDEFVSPDEVFSSSGEHSKKVRLRGTFEWAPPRKQWIFNLHPAQIKLRPMLEKQKYRCAGCGMKLDNKIYARRVRYCDYYGRFFCQCCHRGDKARIPARILQQWCFKEYPVCDLAFRFLREANGQPVFNLMAIDEKLYDRVKALRVVREQRVKLVYMWDYVRTCRWADEVVTKDGNLKTMFTSLPAHLLRETDVYSLADLITVYEGQLLNQLEPIVQYGRYHIEGCEHCRAQAFVCEWCNSEELLFPFQVEKVRRCAACGSLAHIKCVAKNRNGICPKCVRLEQRRIRLTRKSSSRTSLTSTNDDSSI
uniref:Rubicon Homology domain-containing protein n=1 Tax=Plectus sambesii TaxID=2011161 RepID=A0A914WT35_9BILA